MSDDTTPFAPEEFREPAYVHVETGDRWPSLAEYLQHLQSQNVTYGEHCCNNGRVWIDSVLHLREISEESDCPTCFGDPET